MSKRLHADRDSSFINECILKLAALFAPTQFEFPMDLLPSLDAAAPTPTVQAPSVVKIMSESEEGHVGEEGSTPPGKPS